ncbi:MAG: AI-2E family transporter [Clostridia bacterium]|nr:AI-2E family transporter [Clostridia bacterium]
MRLTWKSSLIGCSALFLLFLATRYWDHIAGFAALLAASANTLIVGACIAYIVNILMRMLENRIAPCSRNRLWRKLRRPVCMLLAFVILFAVIFLLVRLIVPQLISCFDNLVKALGDAAPQLYAWLDENLAIGEYLAENNIPTDIASINWRELLEEYAHVLLTGFGGVMNVALTFTTELVGLIVTLFLGIIFACNILAGKEKIGSQYFRLMKRLVGEKATARVRHILQVLDDCFHAYIVGQLTEALILGSLCTLGMLLLSMPYAAMIGTLIGVTALIPIAGAYIGAGLGAIMLFSVSPYQALGFLVFILLLQQFEGNIIYPRTVGSSLHLPGIWVLAAVTIGGGVMGVAGMLIFVPLTAAAYRLLGEWTRTEGKPSLAERISGFGSEAMTMSEGVSMANDNSVIDNAVPQKEKVNSSYRRGRKRR